MIPEVAAETVDRERQGLTAGCNPAHRAPPLAMAGFLPDERLMAFARYEAALTHKHPIAGDVSAAVVVLCRALLRGVPTTRPEKWLQAAVCGKLSRRSWTPTHVRLAKEVMRQRRYRRPSTSWSMPPASRSLWRRRSTLLGRPTTLQCLLVQSPAPAGAPLALDPCSCNMPRVEPSEWKLRSPGTAWPKVGNSDYPG